MRLKRWIVTTLEHPLCTWTHFVTLHRPWLWIGRNCPLTFLSYWLDERWGTGVYGPG